MGSKPRPTNRRRQPNDGRRREEPDVTSRVRSGVAKSGFNSGSPRLQKPIAGRRKLTRTEFFFAITLFVSAALLFSVQPMFAKMVLPLLGGAPAVWNTCLVFYQAVLLMGYLYAHLSLKWLGPRRQAWLHLLLLCLPWIVLPISVAHDWVPPPGVFPVFWLWMLLSVSVGLPFLLVSASAPMLQAWFSETGEPDGQDPYFLYAASNLGSLLALLSYPLLIESHLTLSAQSWAWAIGYGLLMALIAGCAIQLLRSPRADSQIGSDEGDSRIFADTKIGTVPSERPGWRRRLHWLALSFVPSSLLLGVTTYISTDLAAIPLFWVIPLALYLLTFVFVFARRAVLPLPLMLRMQPYLLVAAAGTLTGNVEAPMQLLVLGLLQLSAFFVTAMVCHGQLAADRPAGRYLTEFYLWMSLGGVLGGLFNAFVAPLAFSGAVEYPLMLAVACALRPATEVPLRDVRARVREVALPAAILLVCGVAIWIIRSRVELATWQDVDVMAAKLALVGPAMIAAFLLVHRPFTFGLGVAALLGVSMCYPEGKAHVIDARRSFFGVLRVKDDPQWHVHELMHGSTRHGNQSLDEKGRFEPWGYYNQEGPLGHIFQALRPRRPLAEIGVLGLGTGTVAAYGQSGERITFYEIDPNVERVARDPCFFTYLADCRAKTEVIMGDARLSLIHGPARQFDLLVLDVFSSDSVPIHLITREALQIYLDRLAKHGLLAIHISGRYLNLEPILGKLAQDAHLVARVCHDDYAFVGPKRWASMWVVMARQTSDLGTIGTDPDWTPIPVDTGPVWTDDFSNVIGTLRLDGVGE